MFEQLSRSERATLWQYYGSDPAIGHSGGQVFSEYRSRHAETLNARDVSMAGTPGRELSIWGALNRGEGVPTALLITLQCREDIPQGRRQQAGENLAGYVRRVITDPAPNGTTDLVRDEQQRLARAEVTRDRLRAARDNLRGPEATPQPPTTTGPTEAATEAATVPASACNHPFDAVPPQRGPPLKRAEDEGVTPSEQPCAPRATPRMAASFATTSSLDRGPQRAPSPYGSTPQPPASHTHAARVTTTRGHPDRHHGGHDPGHPPRRR